MRRLSASLLFPLLLLFLMTVGCALCDQSAPAASAEAAPTANATGQSPPVRLARDTVAALCKHYRLNELEDAFYLFDPEVEVDLTLFNSYAHTSWARLYSWRHDFGTFFKQFAAEYRRVDYECRIKSANEESGQVLVDVRQRLIVKRTQKQLVLREYHVYDVRRALITRLLASPINGDQLAAASRNRSELAADRMMRALTNQDAHYIGDSIDFGFKLTVTSPWSSFPLAGDYTDVGGLQQLFAKWRQLWRTRTAQAKRIDYGQKYALDLYTMLLAAPTSRQQSRVAVLAFMLINEDYVDSVLLNFDAPDLAALF